MNKQPQQASSPKLKLTAVRARLDAPPPLPAARQHRVQGVERRGGRLRLRLLLLRLLCLGPCCVAGQQLILAAAASLLELGRRRSSSRDAAESLRQLGSSTEKDQMESIPIQSIQHSPQHPQSTVNRRALAPPPPAPPAPRRCCCPPWGPPRPAGRHWQRWPPRPSPHC